MQKLFYLFSKSSINLSVNKNGFKVKGKVLLFICLFFPFLMQFSCDTTEPPIIPPPDLRKITLTFEDASCTEVWLKIKADSLTLPAEIKLLSDAVTLNVMLTTKDTVLYIDSLSPNQTYNYQAVLSTDTTIKSEKVTAQTLAPTSHNFTWQSWEFGQHSSSILYDVAIIDENNIWAVGEIFMNDSLGNPDPTFFNAAHWDGNNWELKRILYQGSIWSIKTIYAFSENDIWFSAFVRYLNGQFIDLPIPAILMGWSKNKIWGSSSNDLYVVGSAGNIVHATATQFGYNFTKIESGTTLHLTDIYGDTEGNIYAAGVNIPSIKGVVIKSNTTNQWDVMIEGEVIDEGQLFTKLFGSFGAIWIDEIGTVYTGGNLMYEYKNTKWNYVTSLPENFMGGNPGTYYRGFINSIGGNASNDMIIAGDRNTLKHFNGLTWEQIGLPYDPSSDIIWARVEIKGNMSVAVGDEGIKAKIIMLKR